MYETSRQSRFNARYWMLGAGALGRPRGMVWGGRRVQDGEHMYTCGGFISILDRKSTRLNSSHQLISYAVFCLKKKKPKADRPAKNKTGTQGKLPAKATPNH